MVDLAHVQKKIPRVPAVIAILIFLYFLFLHPISGALGGILFFIFGMFIPSVVNLLLSYYIAFKLLPFTHWFKKSVCFFLISLVLGLNTNLLMLVGYYNPKNISIQVMKPLHLPVSKLTLTTQAASLDNSQGDIQAYPFEFYLFDGDGASGMVYFRHPSQLYKQYIGDINKTAYNPKMFCDYRANTYINAQTETKVSYSKVLFSISLKDNDGGYVIARATYPRWLLIYPSHFELSKDIYEPPHVALSKDPHFWAEAWNEFIHCNFWNLLFKTSLHNPRVKTIFDLLTPEEQKKIFIPISD